MSITKTYFLVRIDKKKQLDKQAKFKNIRLDPRYIYQAYNLQYGPILEIGSEAHMNFPDAEVGDTAIFHHTVEGKASALLTIEENNDEIRVARLSDDLMANQVYAVIKPTGELIPHPNWIFIGPQVSRIREKNESVILKQLPAEMYEDADYLREMLQTLAQSIASLETTMAHSKDFQLRRDCKINIEGMRREQETISRVINADKLTKATVFFLHPTLAEEMGISQLQEIVVRDAQAIIPIMFDDKYFGLVISELVVAKYPAQFLN